MFAWPLNRHRVLLGLAWIRPSSKHAGSSGDAHAVVGAPVSSINLAGPDNPTRTSSANTTKHCFAHHRTEASIATGSADRAPCIAAQALNFTKPADRATPSTPLVADGFGGRKEGLRWELSCAGQVQVPAKLSRGPSLGVSRLTSQPVACHHEPSHRRLTRSPACKHDGRLVTRQTARS